MKKGTISLLGAMLIGLLLAAAPGFCGDKVEKTFQAGPGGRLVLESDMGKIVVSGTSEDRVRIEVTANRDIEDLVDLSFDQTGDEIVVRAKREVNRWFNNLFGQSHNLKFTVSVPRQFDLDLRTGGGSMEVSLVDGGVKLRTSGGSIEVGSVNGSLDCHTSGGSIRLREIKGPVEAVTSGGSVTASQVAGDAVLRTSGGSIRAESNSGSLEAHTSGGSIHIAGNQGNVAASNSGGSITISGNKGNVQARTSGGRVRAEMLEPPTADCEVWSSGGGISLSIPRATNARLDAFTSGGSVTTSLPVTVEGVIKRGKLEGRLGQGGPSIVLHTSGGSIDIEPID